MWTMTFGKTSTYWSRVFDTILPGQNIQSYRWSTCWSVIILMLVPYGPLQITQSVYLDQCSLRECASPTRKKKWQVHRCRVYMFHQSTNFKYCALPRPGGYPVRWMPSNVVQEAHVLFVLLACRILCERHFESSRERKKCALGRPFQYTSVSYNCFFAVERRQKTRIIMRNVAPFNHGCCAAHALDITTCCNTIPTLHIGIAKASSSHCILRGDLS